MNLEGRTEIFEYVIDTAALQRLTDHPARDYCPVFSPDGSQIAFVSHRDGFKEQDSDIWVMAADGSNLRQLTYNKGVDLGAPCLAPRLTRRNRRILIRRSSSGRCPILSSAVWSIPPFGARSDTRIGPIANSHMLP